MSWAQARDVEPPRYTIAEYRVKWAEVKAKSAELDGPSLADRLALCELESPGAIDELLDELGPDGAKALAFDRDFWLRPKQLYPFRTAGAWRVLVYLAGRGNGKTRMAAEWVIWRLEQGARELVFVGPTDDDIRQFMLGGVKARLETGTGAGFLDCLPPWIRYVHKQDKGEIEFPDYHARITLVSAYASPEYRGPEPDTVWGDEVLKWRYADQLLSNLRLACRAVGKLRPAILLTTSPRKLRFLRDLVMDPSVDVLWGETDENRGNVDERWLADQHQRLDGTRQGAEELGGELGFEDDGDLFKLSIIDELRVLHAPALDRIVISVDPSASEAERADECGIIAVGRAGDVRTGEAYVLDDLSGHLEWSAWGRTVVEAAVKFGASAIVAEKNKYAGSVRANIIQAAIAFGWEARPRPGFKHLVDLVHPQSGRRIQLIEVLSEGDKWSRNSLLATLYESKRVHHVGHYHALETEQTSFQANASSRRSPNRLDALTAGATELFELDRPPQHNGKQVMRGFSEANEALNAAAAVSGDRSWVSAGIGDRDTI